MRILVASLRVGWRPPDLTLQCHRSSRRGLEFGAESHSMAAAALDGVFRTVRVDNEVIRGRSIRAEVEVEVERCSRGNKAYLSRAENADALLD